jgi:excinuclease ABC subunit C
MLDLESDICTENTLEEGAAIIRTIVMKLPSLPGVYRMINHKGDVLYVGKANSLKKRVHSYTQIHKLPNRLQRMVAETKNLEIVTTHTEIEALLLESNLIKKLQPRYNILLKDDKSFPYILLTKDHNFSRIFKHRGPRVVSGDYFGPFASISAVDEAILTLQRVFQIRNCQDTYFASRTRPCLQYHIKRCTAPCVGLISKDEYVENVKQAKHFLLGKTDWVQRQLAEKMNESSELLNFEKAASYRDRIRLLTQIQSRQRINISGLRNGDVIALAQIGGKACVQIFFFRHGQNLGTESFMISHSVEQSGEAIMAAFINQFYRDRLPASVVLLSHVPEEFELINEALKLQHGQTTKWEIPKLGLKRELIEHALANARGTLERQQAENATVKKVFQQLMEIFNLPKIPDRIEIYDNSHIQGKDAYGVMVAANQDGFDKKSYRKFIIKELHGKGDDYAMMREVMRRRFSHQEDWLFPDLLLIDGGQGQLSSVLQVMDEMGIEIPVVAIAKGPDRNAGKEKFYMLSKESFSLPENSSVLHFLQRLRDEAHRFAIGTHRAKRQKKISSSLLDEISGIGSARKKKLLQHFGSAQHVAKAGLADLQLVEGINKTVALKIYQHFHDQ